MNEVASWTLPASAAEVAAYVDRVGEVHLHQGTNGWRLTFIETGRCGTSDCFVRRVSRITEAPKEA